MKRVMMVTDPRDTSWVKHLPEKIEFIKQGRKEDSYYLARNLIASYDIETTNVPKYDDNGHIDTMASFVIPYSFQFAIKEVGKNEYIYFQFRHKEDFKTFINETFTKVLRLQADQYIYTGVHNLNFEFSNTKDLFAWEHESCFFNNSARRLNNIRCPGIIFHDTSQLDPRKLDSIGKDLGYPKGKNFNYDLIRTPLTPLTADELDYCERDVAIVLLFLEYKIGQFNGVENLKLTQTGETRALFKGVMRGKEAKKHRQMLKAQQISLESYTAYREAYNGGYTHANRAYINQVMENVQGFDVASMYPAMMISRKFPIGEVKEYDNISKDFLYNLSQHSCWWGTFCFYDIKTEHQAPSIFRKDNIQQTSNAIWSNGKLLSADFIVLSLLDVDFKRVEEIYQFSDVAVSTVFASRKDYLPPMIIEFILSLYGKKTTFKGDDDKAEEYKTAKIAINSTYGMTCTDIMRDEYILTPENDVLKLTKTIEDKMDDIYAYNDQKSPYLSAFWGAYIAGYARETLFEVIDAVGNDFVYCDTDSVYTTSTDIDTYIIDINDAIQKRCRDVLTSLGIDVNLLTPRTKSELNSEGVLIPGEMKPIGVWEKDSYTYKKFKTLGAKSYLSYGQEDGQDKWKLTHSGLPKSAIDYILSPVDGKGNPKRTGFDFFTFETDEDGFPMSFTIPASHSGLKGKIYIETPHSGTISDYLGIPYDYDEKYGLLLYDREYRNKVSEVFLKMSKQIKIIEKKLDK